MNPNIFFIFVFLLLVSGAANLDMDCQVSSCGDIANIRYPFWLGGEQPSYCGFPDFELQCEDGIPLIRMPSGVYRVEKIFYENNSLVVADYGLAISQCPVFHSNLSFAVTPFAISPVVNRELYFLFNCSRVGPDYFRVGCATTDASFYYLGGDYGSPEYINQSCLAAARMPVLGNPRADSSQYRTLLRNGFLLDYTVTDCEQCTASNGQCGYSNETKSFICICSDRLHWDSCEKTNVKKTAIGIVGGTVALVTACGIVICCYYRIYRKKSPNNDQNVENFLKKHGSLAPKRYKYSDVKKITESFRNKLGQGGYGSVFKGTLIDGRLVAVKVLSDSKGNGEDFFNEIASTGRSSHVNIVNLLGFCSEGSKRALIYEYMCNGSLDKLICSKEPKTTLRWEKLYQIAIGIARGLEYLHRGCNTRIVHFDIKPHNILLDEDFRPKISDFGLSKLCLRKDSILSMEGTRGTVGYIAPEVFCRNFGVVSSKSDIYSYGMMVLEMAGGRENIPLDVQDTSETYFPFSIYKHLDHSGGLQAYGATAETEEVVRKMILVGLWCIQTMPQNRPSITKVIEMLEGSIDDLQVPPKPNLSFPSFGPIMDISSCSNDGCSSAVH
ncbi:LEAF RUST 10 DISEASE-RESISTANCE LOCUS RECEPTOR-LIKE PROTEIN KINASE-like 2.1 [Iris pallida]|uniref:LEAF RUST 10 DISEASE-RESISTANCE LOCUS RECEPTOR-LIKE PROTEIN KINASE-like 2.1 n=1 Tax=Iris pallida TaxID=29817 RepID=A0AAX6HMW2_IRIPA|nr:LEAF RUST 10 DISEASE-RESISTANCE LOCUS RECEPTOR-LIKE PROTEIN KINASE-like 2.1 [Iris pallida]KAJ6842083.1 LEAF RUST 10 DISEASE-RESISTANCE LOCUS RECEPTOR-LIKE PROTEIN KINASE-like 2.1 [Iris pallida]